MKKWIINLIIPTAFLLLSACGGGGGGVTTANSNTILTALDGEQLYIDKCQSCHGVGGVGGSNSNVQGDRAAFILNRIVEVAAMQNISLSISEATAMSSFLAYSNQWSRITGFSDVDRNGLYGEKKVTSTNKTPGARRDSVTWTDKDGIFWLFGGSGFDIAGSFENRLNDLWKFDGAYWTWVSGSDTAAQPSIVVTADTPNPANVPGARFGSTSMIDSNGNLFLFGGLGSNSAGQFGFLNDLWKFDGTNWSFVTYSGRNATGVEIDTAGIYGQRRVTESINQPGARFNSSGWVDANNNLWVFGGQAYGEDTNFGLLNDLWKFDGVNWTWVSGGTTTTSTGRWGMVGETNPLVVFPAPRENSLTWVDSNDVFWMFGGRGKDRFGNVGRLNDLWKFEPITGYWTWMSGSNLRDKTSIYGVSAVPGAREESVSWIDADDNLWLFGGEGIYTTGVSGTLNDLWRYDGTNWTWVSGSKLSDQASDLAILPADGGPTLGSIGAGVSFIDIDDNLWIFGGYGSDVLNNNGVFNDLWRFKP